MLLTRKELRTILANFRVSVPTEVEKQLLDQFGHPVIDDDGHTRDYTEQHIYEHLRKRLYPYCQTKQC